MPTIALVNSVAYNALESVGKDPVKDFPPIRVFGTVGFIISMLCTNWVKIGGVAMQDSYTQLITSGVLSLVLCGYALTMPPVPTKEGQAGQSLFAADPALANTFAVKNSNALLAISQASETLCILLIPFFMKRFGMKNVMLIAMFAWVFRFGFFGLGSPSMPGVILFILSCIVYGVAFDFFNISGSLYVNENTTTDIRSSAQGLFMLMTNGLGASIGTLAAGWVVEKCGCFTNPSAWSKAWYIFACYALVVGILFMILFKDPRKVKAAQAAASSDNAQA